MEVAPVSAAVRLMAAVLDVTVDELIDRALSDLVDRLKAEDEDIAAAHDALMRLEARRCGATRADCIAREEQAEEPPPIEYAIEPIEVGTDDSPEETEKPDETPFVEELPPPRKNARAVVPEESRRQAASFVREARRRARMSQMQVASDVHVSDQVVSMVERADPRVGAGTLRVLVEWAKQIPA